jgi:hypothetical protein
MILYTRTCIVHVLLPSRDSHFKLERIDVTTPGSRSWKLFEQIVLLLDVHSLVGISSFCFMGPIQQFMSYNELRLLSSDIIDLYNIEVWFGI